jgi:hypothetical protein
MVWRSLLAVAHALLGRIGTRPTTAYSSTSSGNADYIDLREGTKALFSDFAGVFTNRIVIPREDDTPEQVRLSIVTTNFFQLTGGRVQLGRDFTVQDGLPQPPAPQRPAAQGTPPPRLPQFAILSSTCRLPASATSP